MAVLFDLDGVFYQGDTAIAGAAETAAWIREQQVPHLFVTNTTSRPRVELIKKLARFGVPTDEARILTPAVVARNWCQRNLGGEGVALFVPAQTVADFDGLQISADEDEPVAAVVVGDLGRRWDFATLNRAFRLLMKEPRPRLLALGMTRYWESGDGLQLDVAPFVVALAHATGAEPLVMGKPAPSFFAAAADLLGVGRGELVMVGDDIRGDVDGAQGAGIRGVLVRTGKFRDSDLELGIEPAGVLDSIAGFPDWYSRDSRSARKTVRQSPENV